MNAVGVEGDEERSYKWRKRRRSLSLSLSLSLAKEMIATASHN